jgi:hypothetical protein
MEKSLLLTPADVTKLIEIKGKIDHAVAAKSRRTQILALVDVQSQLTQLLHWFISRDL